MSRNPNGTPPLNHETDSEASESENEDDASTCTSSEMEGDATASSTTSEVTYPPHYDFLEYLEHLVTAYYHEKHQTNEGVAVLSSDQVNMFLKAVKYNKIVQKHYVIPNPKQLQTTRRRVINNDSNAVVLERHQSTCERLNMDQTTRTRESEGSIRVGGSGGIVGQGSIDARLRHRREIRNSRLSQQTSGSETGTEIPVGPYTSTAVNETDTTTENLVVAEFELKIKSSYKIKYSLKHDSFLKKIAEKVCRKHVAVKNLPGAKKCRPILKGNKVEDANVGYVVLSGIAIFAESDLEEETDIYGRTLS